MKEIELPQYQSVKLAAAISGTIGTCTAFVFGYRSPDGVSGSVFPTDHPSAAAGHIFILVFADKTENGLGGTVSDLISRSCDGLACTILMHKASVLATESLNMRWFFDRILRGGRRLCLDKNNVPYLKFDGLTAKDPDAMQKYWYKCEAVASFYLESASESPRLDVELIKVSLLSQALEFLALGLIKIFLGYSPNCYSLKFLFALCGYFTGIPSRIFSSSDNPDPRYRRLFAPPTMLRHWNELAMPESDFDVLLKACREFREQATSLANEELNKLQIIKD